MNQRRNILNWGVGFSAATGVLLALVATRFIEYMPKVDSLEGVLFLSTGLFSHFSLISLIFFALVILPLGLISPKANQFIRQLSIIAATIGTVLLIADTFVYSQYRFHITGFVFEMLIQGGSQIIDLSWATWATIGLSLVGIYLMYFAISHWIWKNTDLPLFSKQKKFYFLFFFCCLLASNLLHLWADTVYDQRITSLVRHVPMFSPATGREALLSTGLVDAQSIREKRHDFKLAQSTNLVYPKGTVSTQPPAEKTNVLWVLLDSTRLDVLDPNIMPNYWAFSQGPQSQVFQNHLSGGNSTRTGVFNMFYGLPGTYWEAFTASQTAPVIMDAFQNHGYDISIHASAPLTQPAFDRTIFANLDGFALRTEADSPWERDEKITNDWLAFMDKRIKAQEDKPFFGFLFFDGIHGFSVPNPADGPFQPAWNRVDHLSLNRELNPEPYINLYKNAAYQVDLQLGRVLDQLEKANLMDNTMVIITSDHGQEFNDNGLNYWGHGSNFTPAQIHVPMVLHWPGKEKATYSHRTTHSDLSVTLMEELFNTNTPKRAYSLGHHLFETQRESWTIVGSYVNYAVVEPEYQVVTYQTGHYEVLDNTARPKPEQKINGQTAIEVMKALSHFYKDN